MASSKTDLDHWRISATVHADRVEEVRYFTDTARGIRRQQYTKVWRIDRHLGRGGYGEVRLEKSLSRDGGEEARAVKKIPGKEWSDKKCEKELKALLEFSKPKFRESAVFVDFYGWFRERSDIFLAMEYVPLGDLEENVKKCSSGKVPESEAREITEQILGALQFMHAESFAHRDLKPQNILVVHGSPTWWIKVADFGLSKKLTETSGYETVAGTQSYMAPEIMNSGSKGEYTNAVDIWAVGCILYRIATGNPPFSYLTLGPYCVDKTLFPLDPLIENKMGGMGCMFIQELLAVQPNERPSASVALTRNWIRLDPKTKAGNASKNTPRPAQQIQVSEPQLSEMTFDTATHDGLKTYSPPPPDRDGSSKNGPSKPASTTPKDTDIHVPKKTVPLLMLKHMTPAALSSRLAQKTPTAREVSPAPPLPTTGNKIRVLPKQQPVQAVLTARPAPPLPTTGNSTPEPRIPLDDHHKTLGSEYTEDVIAAALSPDGKRLASVWADLTVRLWDVKKASLTSEVKLSKTPQPHSRNELVSAFHFRLRQLMFAWTGGTAGRYITIHDAVTGAQQHVLKGREKLPIIHMAYSPSGLQLVVVKADYSIVVYDPKKGTLLKSYEAKPDHTPRIQSNEGALQIYLEPCRSEMWYWTATHEKSISAIVTDGKTIRVWNHDTGHVMALLKRNRFRFQCLLFSPDTKYLISGSSNGGVQIWDIATGSCQSLEAHTPRTITWMGLSPDGKVLATISNKSAIKLWEFEYLKKNLPMTIKVSEKDSGKESDSGKEKDNGKEKEKDNGKEKKDENGKEKGKK